MGFVVHEFCTFMGFLVSWVLWFHRFRGVKDIKVSVVLWFHLGLWFQMYRGAIGFSVSWFRMLHGFICFCGFIFHVIMVSMNIHSNKHLFVENQHMQLSDTSRQKKKRMRQKKEENILLILE